MVLVSLVLIWLRSVPIENKASLLDLIKKFGIKYRVEDVGMR